MEKLIIDYKLMTSDEPAKLSQSISSEVRVGGWQPLGGISISSIQDMNNSSRVITIFAQALVKYKG